MPAINYLKDTAFDLRKFISSQYLYMGLRATFAIVFPCLVLAYFGLLKEYFAFPIGTMFLISIDQPGPYHRRRNTLIAGIISFFVVALTISMTYQIPALVILEIILFGMFFSLIGVYGSRMAALGTLTLIVFAILTNGGFGGAGPYKTALSIMGGATWGFLVFLILDKVQPLLLVKKILGESFIDLGDYIEIKAHFYLPDADYDALIAELLTLQVKLKTRQEELREILFATRQFIKESTKESREIMFLFVESIDLFEEVYTSQQDYRKLHEKFGGTEVLRKLHRYIEILSSEVIHIGASLQGNRRAYPLRHLDKELTACYDTYFQYRSKEMTDKNLEDFMMVRQILTNVREITRRIKVLYRAMGKDESLKTSFGLKLTRFAPKTQRFKLRVLEMNLSLKSGHFRHAIRITVALLLGYSVSMLAFHQLGHTYWILITILAILKPAFSNSRQRNTYRLVGTFAGALVGFGLLFFVENGSVLFAILLVCMTLFYALNRVNYMIAVFFMTIFVFMSFNILNPGHVQVLLTDRLADTAIGSGISFLVAYLVLPVWERHENKDYLSQTLLANKNYFLAVVKLLRKSEPGSQQNYKETRKEAMIALANLSDHFQRLLTDPKSQRHYRMKDIHQYVNMSNLVTSYTASLAMYALRKEEFPEVRIDNWMKRILYAFVQMELLLQIPGIYEEDLKALEDFEMHPTDVETLLDKRRREIQEKSAHLSLKQREVNRLTDLRNITELFNLIANVAEGQVQIVRRIVQPAKDSDTVANRKFPNLFNWAKKSSDSDSL